MTDLESELNYSCPVGMRALRRGDMIQIDGGPGVVVRVTPCNALVIPVFAKPRRIVSRSEGGEGRLVCPAPIPVRIAANVEPSRILRHLEEQDMEEFLAHRTPQAVVRNNPTTAADKEEHSVANKKYKCNKAEQATDENAEAGKAPQAPKKQKATEAEKVAQAAGVALKTDDDGGRIRGRLGQLWGHSVVRVIMAAGAAGASKEKIDEMLRKHGIKAAAGTIVANRRCGVNGMHGADLAPEQLKEFEA